MTYTLTIVKNTVRGVEEKTPALHRICQAVLYGEVRWYNGKEWGLEEAQSRG